MQVVRENLFLEFILQKCGSHRKWRLPVRWNKEGCYSNLCTWHGSKLSKSAICCAIWATFECCRLYPASWSWWARWKAGTLCDILHQTAALQVWKRSQDSNKITGMPTPSLVWSLQWLCISLITKPFMLLKLSTAVCAFFGRLVM